MQPLAGTRSVALAGPASRRYRAGASGAKIRAEYERETAKLSAERARELDKAGDEYFPELAKAERELERELAKGGQPGKAIRKYREKLRALDAKFGEKLGRSTASSTRRSGNASGT